MRANVAMLSIVSEYPSEKKEEIRHALIQLGKMAPYCPTRTRMMNREQFSAMMQPRRTHSMASEMMTTVDQHSNVIYASRTDSASRSTTGVPLLNLKHSSEAVLYSVLQYLTVPRGIMPPPESALNYVAKAYDEEEYDRDRLMKVYATIIVANGLAEKGIDLMGEVTEGEASGTMDLWKSQCAKIKTWAT